MCEIRDNCSGNCMKPLKVHSTPDSELLDVKADDTVITEL
jgi:hypothetical protein